MAFIILSTTIIKQVQQLLRKNSHVFISGDRQSPHLCTRAANALPLPQASLGLLIKDKMSHQTETWQTEPSGKLVMMGNMRALLPWVRETDFPAQAICSSQGHFQNNQGELWSHMVLFTGQLNSGLLVLCWVGQNLHLDFS